MPKIINTPVKDKEDYVKIFSKLSGDENFSKYDSIGRLNYYSRGILSSVFMEIEEMFCWYFEKNFKGLALSSMNQFNNPKIRGAYFTYEYYDAELKVQIKKWMENKYKHLNQRTYSNKWNTTNIAEYFKSLQWNKKILFISKIKGESFKWIFKNSTHSQGLQDDWIMSFLHKIRILRNHVSHSYWCLHNKWFADIVTRSFLVGPGNKKIKTNLTTRNFLNTLTNLFQIFESTIQDEYKSSLSRVARAEDCILLKELENDIFWNNL